MTPVGGDPPSVPPVPEPGPAAGLPRSSPALLPGLLVAGGVLAMIACITGLFVVGVTRERKISSAPRSAAAAVTPRAHVPAPPVAKAPEPAENAPLPPSAAPETRGVARPEDEASPLTVTASDAVWGEPNAPVTLVSFLDFECEYSRQTLPDLVRLKSEFGQDLRWVFKQRPLGENALAMHAARTFAKVSDAYGNVGFFRLVVETAHSEEPLSRASLDRWLERSGLEPENLAGPAHEAGALARVSADVDLSARFGVRSTPALFINGLRVDGLRSLAELRSIVGRELLTARWLRAGGMPESWIYLRRTQHNLLGLGDAAPSRECVPIEGSPAHGPESALVTIVQFSDYECNFCRQSAPVLKALMPRFKDELKMVSKSFPLPQHPQARAAANFALEAREIGGDRAFWQVHELLLAQRSELDESVLLDVARRAGIAEKPLLEAVRSGRHDAAINADLKLGQRLDVEGVPTFFVNGRRISGVASRQSFEALLREELAAAKKIAQRERGPGAIYGFLCGR